MDTLSEYYIAALSAVIAAIVSLFISWKSHKRSKEQTIEGITVELVKLRVQPYSVFMKRLSSFSSQEFINDVDDQARMKRAESAIDVFNSAIYGEIGLLASYETRETIVHARSVFRNYSKGANNYPRVKKAIWSLHQLLRSDLSLRQPGLTREIESIHKKVSTLRIADVERVLKGIQHLDWEEHEKEN
jgi:hypothetical protein